MATPKGGPDAIQRRRKSDGSAAIAPAKPKRPSKASFSAVDQIFSLFPFIMDRFNRFAPKCGENGWIGSPSFRKCVEG
jgi:hypothetical protein